MHEEIISKYNSLRDKSLSIDITRGKPDTFQLDLSNKLLDMQVQPIDEDGVDIRNYGEPYGIKAARELGASLLNAEFESIITGEQSSLLLSYQTVLATICLLLRLHGKILIVPNLFAQFQVSIDILECLMTLVLRLFQSH